MCSERRETKESERERLAYGWYTYSRSVVMRRALGPRLNGAMLLQLMATMLLALPILGVLATTTGSTSTSAAKVKTYENDTVVLPCHVEDLGLRTRVRWWRGKVLLADSEQPTVAPAGQQQQRVKMWGNRSLELAGVRPEDSGEYTCQASRPEPWGHVTQVHEIQVMYPASVKPIPESSQLEVSLGEEAVLGCESSGVPKPTIAWLFEGQELPVITSGEKLRVRADNRSLAGIYTCEANNGIGEPARTSIELKIKHKPEVRAISRWLHSAPGVRVQLECLVQAWPEAQLEWFFEGARLAQQQRLSRYLRRDHDEPGLGGQLYSLTIRSAEAQDLGQYSCKASNELGSAEASIELSGRPKVPLLKKEARASSSSSYNFIFEADSYSPVVEYQFWFRQMDSREDWHRLHVPSGNEAAGPLHARSYNLTGLPASRQYEALVLARNRFGWSSPSKIVRFATVPASTSAEEEAYKIDGAGHEKIPSAVQVTSDSHRSALDSNSSGPGCCLYSSTTLTLLLLMAFAASRS